MEMIKLLSGLPCVLTIIWAFGYMIIFSKGYYPTKWYKLVGLILFVLSILDVFIINADLYPKY